MRSGDLNKRIILQAKSRTADGYGGMVIVWTDIATIWAAIWPISAKEQSRSMQETMTISHRIRINYRSRFSQAWRIKFGNRYFNIVSFLNPNEYGEWLDLMCKEVAK